MFDTKFFPGAKKFWHMGKFYDWDSLNVHVMSHAVHYGSSVFEGIRAYETATGPAIFRLPEHIERFFLSASTLNMKVPFSPEKITDVIKDVMKINKLRAAYIRPNLFFAYGNLGLVPKVSPVELTIGCWSWGAYLGDESLEKVSIPCFLIAAGFIPVKWICGQRLVACMHSLILPEAMPGRLVLMKEFSSIWKVVSPKDQGKI